MKILCTYATRQIDSNLMMASTIFDGLSQLPSCQVDMIFLSYDAPAEHFRRNYEKYFNKVTYLPLRKRFTERVARWLRLPDVLVSYMENFVLDGIRLARKQLIYSGLRGGGGYDAILSFVPPALSGFIGIDAKRACPKARLIQFWTDPLSLGRCNSPSEIPWHRF